MSEQTGQLDQRVHPEAGQAGWEWHEPRSGEHFRTCSWCGSIHPEDLAAEESWVPQWADMKYGYPHKFYVDVTNRDPERLYVLGSGSGGEQPVIMGEAWTPAAELTAEQREVAERDGYTAEDWPDFFYFGLRPAHHAKFYTVHLADAGLPAETKTAIEQGSGVAFEFAEDGLRLRVVEQPPVL